MVNARERLKYDHTDPETGDYFFITDGSRRPFRFNEEQGRHLYGFPRIYMYPSGEIYDGEGVFLEKYEGDYTILNDLKMGVLHLAAQGDKINSVLYLHEMELDINLKDAKLSTPLHWAAFSGSDKIIEYLLAQ